VGLCAPIRVRTRPPCRAHRWYRVRDLYARRPCVCILLAALAAVAPPVTPAAVPGDEAIAGHERDLADVERRAQDLEHRLQEHRGRREDLLAELERRERQIGDLALASRRLTAAIAEQEERVGELATRLAGARGAIRRERAALASLLRSAYAGGRGEGVRLLLDLEDLSRLSRVMSYYDYLNRFRMERIERSLAAARSLEELANQARAEKARLQGLAQEQDRNRARLTAAQDERSALLQALERTIASETEQVSDLQGEVRRLRHLLEQLARQALALPEDEVRQESLGQLRGRLSWPVAGATLLSPFGSPKDEGAQHWDGVLLQVEEGAEVRAVHHGRVAYADWLRGFGLLLIIEHGDEYMTLYGHNQALLVEPGDWVAPGEPIALSGKSGGRSLPGLYFAIRHRGRPLDPGQWCRQQTGYGRSGATGSHPGGSPGGGSRPRGGSDSDPNRHSAAPESWASRGAAAEQGPLSRLESRTCWQVSDARGTLFAADLGFPLPVLPL